MKNFEIQTLLQYDKTKHKRVFLPSNPAQLQIFIGHEIEIQSHTTMCIYIRGGDWLAKLKAEEHDLRVK